MKVKKIGHTRLCNLPTPLMEAPRLSAKLGGPQILIKRDDLTGLAMGGNKARSLEFLMTEAMDMDADIVVAVGPQQSNWLCNLTAAARKLGMDVVLLLLKGTNRIQGNLLLNKLLGADIRFTDIEKPDLSIAHEQMNELADKLRGHGRKPYVLHYGAVAPLGITGYVSLASEICKQLQEKRLEVQYLFLANGSGCTQAGLILGARYHQASFEVVGIMLDSSHSKEVQVRLIADQANETAKFLELNSTFNHEDIICYEEFVGSSAPTKKSVEAVRLVAETEGIFLDPIYSGKAMAALADQVRDGKFNSEDTVILYHSGGLPGIFAYNEELSA
jgi:D-cysteine desulfhydrase family pyridoxal phosphate-dependent enzyme